MTMAQAKTVKPGDKIITRDGWCYKVLEVCRGWNRLYTSKELEALNGKCDFYDFVVS